ncbi:DUF1232 domain-containing protein [Patescibacteria group bacterium]|nr:DUF1232 domain-containing protein [Patescibacteria group bacterium]
MTKKANFIPNWKQLIRFFKDGKTDWKPKVGVAVAIVYLIWPADLIVDLVPFFGWLDDIGITALAIGYLGYAVNRYVKSYNDKEIDSASNQL